MKSPIAILTVTVVLIKISLFSALAVASDPNFKHVLRSDDCPPRVVRAIRTTLLPLRRESSEDSLSKWESCLHALTDDKDFSLRMDWLEQQIRHMIARVAETRSQIEILEDLFIRHWREIDRAAELSVRAIMGESEVDESKLQLRLNLPRPNYDRSGLSRNSHRRVGAANLRITPQIKQLTEAFPAESVVIVGYPPISLQPEIGRVVRSIGSGLIPVFVLTGPQVDTRLMDVHLKKGATLIRTSLTTRGIFARFI